VGRCGLVSYD